MIQSIKFALAKLHILMLVTQYVQCVLQLVKSVIHKIQLVKAVFHVLLKKPIESSKLLLVALVYKDILI
jgi:hypothetical protein